MDVRADDLRSLETPTRVLVASIGILRACREIRIADQRIVNGSTIGGREPRRIGFSMGPEPEISGPAPGQKYSEITFPILSPDPTTKKDVHFLKYPIYVGGNRGRGQIYPDGSKSNNTVYNATGAGIVSKIIRKEKGGYEISITDPSDGRQVVDIIPPGPELLVSEGESIQFDQPLTSNPNVGGFGQGDAEIVLQDPLRVQGLLFFLASVILAQIFLVLKKKQFEKSIDILTRVDKKRIYRYTVICRINNSNDAWTTGKETGFGSESRRVENQWVPAHIPLLGSSIPILINNSTGAWPSGKAAGFGPVQSKLAGTRYCTQHSLYSIGAMLQS
ncbi:apocytochrome f [Striga asiatica]|uniref:Cytochrome f n=1 Tax=Striga asiatica TaxID=4170 RepID=A0A5A7QQY6_STRAF|nr:apocytochrome f [Striga asiatica]